MFFAALFAMYFSIRATEVGQEEWALNTEKLQLPYALTFIMGLIFVLGQVNEYRHLVSEGVKISSDGFGSMFYLTTGFHGLHVTGGLIAFIFFMIRTTLARFTPAQATAAIVVSYYWHFVDLVWIALFAMIYLLQ
jgi:cytochrome c oxidase subunit 3